MHTHYTTPMKPALSMLDQLPDSASVRPLPSLAIPSLETIRDEDDVIDPSSDPEPNCNDRERGGADVGVAAHGEGDADADATPRRGARDTSAAPMGAIDKAPAAGETAGTGMGINSSMHDANSATMEEGSRMPVEDFTTVSALPEVTHPDDADNAVMVGEGECCVPTNCPVTVPAQEDGDVHREDANVSANPEIPETTTHRKRKRQEQRQELTTKRVKSTGEKQAEGVAGVSRRSAQAKLAPPVTPLKTRARAQREAREMREMEMTSTRKTRGRKSRV